MVIKDGTPPTPYIASAELKCKQQNIYNPKE